jgi:hypothetical protein
MTKEKLQSMLNEGYNLNQIASIHMISKTELEKLLVEEITPKVKSKPVVENTPLFPDEPGL